MYVLYWRVYQIIMTKKFLLNWNQFLSIFQKYTQLQFILSYDDSTTLYKFLKTLHPGGIRTRDLLFCRQTRWPLCHYATGSSNNLFLKVFGTKVSPTLTAQKKSFRVPETAASSHTKNWMILNLDTDKNGRWGAWPFARASATRLGEVSPFGGQWPPTCLNND
jgi:hypothetical protein